jgi:predicted amidohydrolase
MASKHTQDQDYELKLVQALCWSRSFETETVLIHVNPGGDRKKGGFMGGSGIWAPLRGKIGGYEREEVGVTFVDVDLGVLKVCLCSALCL